MSDWAQYKDPARTAPPVARGLTLGEISANGGISGFEEYHSPTASTDRNYFVTDAQGRRFFGCDPDLLFLMDEATYRKIQPVSAVRGTPAMLADSVVSGDLTGDPANPVYRATGRDGTELVRRRCEFYMGNGRGIFRQVTARQYFESLGILQPSGEREGDMDDI